MPEQYRLTLSAEEAAMLETVVAQRRATSVVVVRAQYLLAVADNELGWRDTQAVEAYGVSVRTLGRLRQRACEAGVEAALDVLPAASAAGVGRVLKKTNSSRGSGRCG